MMRGKRNFGFDLKLNDLQMFVY